MRSINLSALCASLRVPQREAKKHVEAYQGMSRQGIPRFNLKEEDLVRGDSCLKRPTTPGFDIGSEPEISIEAVDEESNANTDAKERL